MMLQNIIAYAGAKEIIDSFKFSGDWEVDHIKLSNLLERYYYDTVGVYNANIEKAIKVEVNEIIKANYAEITFVIDSYGTLYENDGV